MTDNLTGPVDAGQRGEEAGLGCSTRPVRVAIVGSGPSGFYAAEALVKSLEHVEVHLFERLPVPFGLVRFGVAPDHGKIRKVVAKYNQIARLPQVRFWGNVGIGRDLSVEELSRFFDAVIFAYGSESDRKLNIPGEDLPRSYTATEFCAWYNGHPDYRDRQFDLSQETVVVIGQGNVALDAARILSKPVVDLKATDIAAHALEALGVSRVKTVYCIGRRGPAQAAFTPKELLELGKMPDCELVIDPADLDLAIPCQMEAEMTDRPGVARNLKALRELSEKPTTGASRRIVLRFFQSPVGITGDGGVQSIQLVRNRLEGEPGAQYAVPTDEVETLPCGAVFRSVGYRGVGIEGVPFDEKRGVIANEGGRVEPGVYAAGWIKRGPSGLIGTNKKDSEQTVALLIEDLPMLTPAPTPNDAALHGLLKERGVRVVSFEDWRRIDRIEIERGAAVGKSRENFVTVEQMLGALDPAGVESGGG